ncbi:MAG: hypothetical protein AAFS10_03940 [Myxococcota bacterium]
MTVVFYTPDLYTYQDISRMLRASFPKTPFLGLNLMERLVRWMDHSCEQPDLLLVDIDQQCGEELDLVGRACSRWPETPLVVVSDEPLFGCLASIVHLQKPVCEPEVVRLVHASITGEA